MNNGFCLDIPKRLIYRICMNILCCLFWAFSQLLLFLCCMQRLKRDGGDRRDFAYKNRSQRWMKRFNFEFGGGGETRKPQVT